MTDSTTTTTNMTNVSLPFPPSQPLISRVITCGGQNQYCGHAGCPDLTKDYSRSPLQPIATCGGSLTYCGHLGCPDRTLPRNPTPLEPTPAVGFRSASAAESYPPPKVYKVDEEKRQEYIRNNPVTEPQPLTATASCGGTLTYCRHPWCTDMTIKY